MLAGTHFIKIWNQLKFDPATGQPLNGAKTIFSEHPILVMAASNPTITKSLSKENLRTVVTVITLQIRASLNEIGINDKAQVEGYAVGRITSATYVAENVTKITIEA